MHSHDNYIVFILNVVKVDDPVAGFVVNNRDDFVINEFAVLGEFKPDFVTVDIDLLGFKGIALTEVEDFAGSQGVLLVIVEDQLGKLVSALGLDWDVSLCKEAEYRELGGCIFLVTSSEARSIFEVDHCDRGVVDKFTFRDCGAFSVFNREGFCLGTFIEVIVECCKGVSIHRNTRTNDSIEGGTIVHWTADLNGICCTCARCEYS